MKRLLPRLAVWCLVLLLPVQAWAGACAQVCLAAGQVQEQQREINADPASHDDCGKPAATPGKCCQLQIVAVPQAVVLPKVQAPAFERVSHDTFWASFIPEEPSPPPIA